MAEYLDIAQPIIEIDNETKEFKATPYFENYLYNIVQSIGGEGESDANDAFDLANMHQLLLSMPARIGLAEVAVNDVIQLCAESSYDPRIAECKASIGDLNQLVEAHAAQVGHLGALLVKSNDSLSDVISLMHENISENAKLKSQVSELTLRINDLEQQ